MKIAVTFENGMIFQHFGHTSQFKVYEVDGDTIRSAQVVDTDGSGHGALAGFLKSIGADVLICGGIGGGARAALQEVGIAIYGGVQGGADEAVVAFVANSLRYNPDAKCDHHGHEEGHSCGNHSCGNH